ncbi:8418_t:CDS:2 [Cetraspora pellucida]|uniref:8418_t:CDS:1 n=1 Tax=Cetraspora pellucida TaxID=1433469 RepID=A0A9N9NCJ1_9GLOM|nr:8418_t:CDS:2 [Cetraspora pellucida]
MELNNNEPSNPDSQAYHFLDLDIEVSWPVSFPDNKEYHEFTEIEKLNFKARMTKERAQKILNTINNYKIDEKFLVREASIQSDVERLDSNAAKRWCKQNCLVLIPGLSEKRKLVKNDKIHLSLNTLPNKFLQGMLGKEKAIDWELGYVITIYTKYLSQLIQIEGSLLPSEIEDAKNKKAIKCLLRPFISEKLVGR